MIGTIGPAAWAVFILRWFSVRRMWRLPFKQGPEWCFTTQVGPGFARGRGKLFLRTYHAWLFAPFVVDLFVMPLLLVNGRASHVWEVQIAMLLLTSVYYNLLFYQFASRVRAFAIPTGEPPVTGAHLVMAPRRLSDHTSWIVEAGLTISLILALLMLGRSWEWWMERTPLLWAVVWVLYLQCGLLLLKVVFVHWRIKLPLRRTEEFRRWRAAWLTYHLRSIDALRLILAILLLALAAWQVINKDWENNAVIAALFLFFAGFFVFYVREGRRVKAVQDEVQPLTLAREFPPSPIAEGRFYAGGLLYFNTDNPLALVRSPQGFAVNLAHRATFLWIAYLTGVIVLLAWQISRASQ